MTMEQGEFRKYFWYEASKWGLIVGLILAGTKVLGGLAGPSPVAVLLLAVQIAAVYLVNMGVGRRMSALKGPAGYSFGEAFTQILATMMFAGIIYGAAEFVASRMDPGYFDDILEDIANNPTYREMLGTAGMRQNVKAIAGSPVAMILAGILNVCLPGGIIGIINAALLRRLPDSSPGSGGNEE